jgi:hypothetical protein
VTRCGGAGRGQHYLRGARIAQDRLEGAGVGLSLLTGPGECASASPSLGFEGSTVHSYWEDIERDAS